MTPDLLTHTVPAAEGEAESRRLPPGLRRAVVLTDSPCSEAQAGWLGAHLCAPPPGLELWAVLTLREESEPTAQAVLERICAALTAARRPVTLRTLAGDLRVSLEAMAEVPAALPVLLDEPSGALSRWALRAASGPALLVPGKAPAGAPRVVVLAESAEQVPLLTAWSALLPPGSAVELVGVPERLAERGAAGYVGLSQLEAALEQGARRLGRGGLKVTTRLAAGPEEPRGATLVIRPASRGFLRRWWAGSAERSLRRAPIPVLTVPCPAAA